MKTPLHFLLPVLCAFTLCLNPTISAIAQTATLNFTQVNDASCNGAGSVSAVVSHPNPACSIDGFLPCLTASLHGPGQSGATFNTCHTYGVGANNLEPGDYYYRLTSISPCSGTVEIPFTIESTGVYPDISITTVPVDCNDDDYVTVVNNTDETITMAVLNGSTLGIIAVGQSADYPNTSLDFTLTASTTSCQTPIEYPVDYQTGPGQYPFGFPEVFANVSSVNTSNGLDNGSASATVTSGAAPFQFEWSTGQTVSGVTSSSIENLAPGSYTVDVTSTHGCVYTETVDIAASTDPQSIADMEIQNISIYPNPSNGQFQLNLSQSQFSVKAQIIVTDNTGREVFSQEANSLQPTINLSNASLSKGVYMIRVMENNLVGLSKVTVN